jgi:hypothetical protein
METISIQQPWAWLIVSGQGGKDVENRSRWHYKHRGRVRIHASKTVDGDTSRFPVQWAHIASLGIEIPANLPTGAIVGEATITGTVTESDSPWFEGATGILLSDPIAYADPIPCRGMLGIFQTA